MSSDDWTITLSLISGFVALLMIAWSLSGVSLLRDRQNAEDALYRVRKVVAKHDPHCLCVAEVAAALRGEPEPDPLDEMVNSPEFMDLLSGVEEGEFIHGTYDHETGETTLEKGNIKDLGRDQDDRD